MHDPKTHLHRALDENHMVMYTTVFRSLTQKNYTWRHREMHRYHMHIHSLTHKLGCTSKRETHTNGQVRTHSHTPIIFASHPFHLIVPLD